jgi:endoglucanase
LDATPRGFYLRVVNVSPRRHATLLCLLLGLSLAATLQSATPIAPAVAAGSDPAPTSLSVPVDAASPANPTNPLAGTRWGVYQGLADPAWGPYLDATATQKRLLSPIVNAPKAKFFGRWIPNWQIGQKVREYVANATGGDPSVMVQMTLFRMNPWEGEACRRLPTRAEQASYRDFIDRFARALGSTRAAIIVQPDGPVLHCIPHHSKVPANLLKYTARTLDALPNTAVYMEMGSADWWRNNIRNAVRLLLAEGVASVRGFALDTSHFDSVRNQVVFGTRIARALANRGAGNKHFVIDTSDNGRPFTGKWWHERHPKTLAVGHAAPCSSYTQTHCVTLGIPPTTDVASTRWPLTATQRQLAAQYVDGYLWVSRPWLAHQSGPFSMKRALAELKYWPYR